MLIRSQVLSVNNCQVLQFKMDREEDIVVLLWNFLQLLDNGKQREHWVHPINQKRDIRGFIDELRAYPEKFFNYCRMSISTFDYVLQAIEGKIQKQNTNYRKCISAEERLLITLR